MPVKWFDIKNRDLKEENAQNDIGHAADVVLHLMDDYFGKECILYMGNFYNLVDLADVFKANVRLWHTKK